jgi:hypothetical protein
MAECVYCRVATELYDSGVPVCPKCSSERDRKASKKPPAKSRTIHNLLADEITEATARTNKASQAFLEVVGQIPSGFPHPDGSARIHYASHDLSTARKDLNEGASAAG